MLTSVLYACAEGGRTPSSIFLSSVTVAVYVRAQSTTIDLFSIKKYISDLPCQWLETWDNHPTNFTLRYIEVGLKILRYACKFRKNIAKRRGTILKLLRAVRLKRQVEVSAAPNLIGPKNPQEAEQFADAFFANPEIKKNTAGASVVIVQ